MKFYKLGVIATNRHSTKYPECEQIVQCIIILQSTVHAVFSRFDQIDFNFFVSQHKLMLVENPVMKDCKQFAIPQGMFDH